jgi:PAS domain S-box-containing protein
MNAQSSDPRPSEECSQTAKSPVLRNARSFAIGSGVLVALIAASHVVAWLAGAMAHRGISGITMKTNTALCLLLLGTSLVSTVASDVIGARRLGRCCASFALLIGLLTLSENLIGWDLGIDQILATEPLGALGMLSPNRMGTPASIGITLLGLALLATGRHGTRWLIGAQVAALTVSSIGLLTTVGYTYGVQWLYGVARVTAIAWPTALSLLLLGLGVVCVRPTEGLMTQVTAADSGGVAIRRLLPLLLCPVLFGWLRLLGERSRLYDAAMGTALLMVLFIVLFAGATYLVGRQVSRSSAELERERETLSVTLASIGDAVLACNTAGRITYLNPVASSLTGWSPEAAQNQPVESVFQIINEQTRAPAASIVTQVLQEKHVVALANHTALISKDGHVTPIEDSAAPIIDDKGTLSGVVLVFHDVAEKRRAQQALRESEQRFRLKLESILLPEGDIGNLELADLIDADALSAQLESFYQISGITVGIIDMKGKVLVGVGWQDICTKFHRVNPASCRHCIESDTQLSAGVPEGEHRIYKCKNNMWDVATPIMVGRRHVGNIFTGQFFFNDEVVDRDVFSAQADRFGFGKEEYLAAVDRVPRLTRLAVNEGMAFYAKLSNMLSKLSYSNLALARTLAERDRASASLQESEKRFRLALRNAPVSVAAQDRDLRYVWVYNQRTVSTDQIVGKLDEDIFAPDEAARVTAIKRRVLDEGIELREQMWFKRPGGRMSLDICWEPIRDEAGQVSGVASATVDQTPIRLAEEALRHANTQLAEADLRKNEFLAVLSHELRNPLTPITNSLYVLDHAPPGGEQATRAKEVIARQVSQLSHLVNDLLDVTRITSNKIHLNKERLDLNEVARRAVEDNRSLFQTAGVALELKAAPGPLPVLADRTRIAQIIGNLLQNAAKFAHRGGSTSVSLSTAGSEGTVRVVDDGVGMAPEILGRLFQPFMQADQTLDRSKGGLGLGLALVKGLVELHGGRISAHSEGYGKGTEFLVRLPLHTEVVLTTSPLPSPVARSPRRILIIEDNVDAADSLREALEFGGDQVEVAHNGPDGLASARVFLPEVILCDIGLPGMDGYEVARVFRSDAVFKTTSLVALSGYALPEDVRRASEAGFDRHLAKPPSLEMLQELLESLAGARDESKSSS